MLHSPSIGLKWSLMSEVSVNYAYTRKKKRFAYRVRHSTYLLSFENQISAAVLRRKFGFRIMRNMIFYWLFFLCEHRQSENVARWWLGSDSYSNRICCISFNFKPKGNPNAKVNFFHNVCLFILRFVLSINFKFASQSERKNLNPVNYIDSLEHKRVETLLLWYSWDSLL